jgi:hypothetical protein
MDNHYTAFILSPFLRHGLPLLLFMALSCHTIKEAEVLDRSAIPTADAAVPADISEIRELKYHKVATERGHDVLHLRGMLFAKSDGGGSTLISPCQGCVIRLTSPADTTVSANLTTGADGYFEFNGKVLPYTFAISQPGMNALVIESVKFQKEGITTLKILHARGGTPERFRVTKKGNLYTWTRVQ